MMADLRGAGGKDGNVRKNGRDNKWLSVLFRKMGTWFLSVKKLMTIQEGEKRTGKQNGGDSGKFTKSRRSKFCASTQNDKVACESGGEKKFCSREKDRRNENPGGKGTFKTTIGGQQNGAGGKGKHRDAMGGKNPRKNAQRSREKHEGRETATRWEEGKKARGRRQKRKKGGPGLVAHKIRLVQQTHKEKDRETKTVNYRTTGREKGGDGTSNELKT